MPVLSLSTRIVSAPKGAADEPTTLTLCRSLRSASSNRILPVSIRLPVATSCSVIDPVRSDACMTGASLVPVIATLTVRVVGALLPLLRETMKVSVSFWSLAK